MTNCVCTDFLCNRQSIEQKFNHIKQLIQKGSGKIFILIDDTLSTHFIIQFLRLILFLYYACDSLHNCDCIKIILVAHFKNNQTFYKKDFNLLLKKAKIKTLILETDLNKSNIHNFIKFDSIISEDLKTVLLEKIDFLIRRDFRSQLDYFFNTCCNEMVLGLQPTIFKYVDGLIAEIPTVPVKTIQVNEDVLLHEEKTYKQQKDDTNFKKWLTDKNIMANKKLEIELKEQIDNATKLYNCVKKQLLSEPNVYSDKKILDMSNNIVNTYCQKLIQVHKKIAHLQDKRKYIEYNNIKINSVNQQLVLNLNYSKTVYADGQFNKIKCIIQIKRLAVDIFI